MKFLCKTGIFICREVCAGSTIFAFSSTQNCELSARRSVLSEILEFWASSGIMLIHSGLHPIAAEVCNLSNCKKAPFGGKRATLALPNDSFCSAIVIVLHSKRGRSARIMYSFCSWKAVILGLKRSSGGIKSIKNDSGNLQNRFLFCNSFLLHVLYLHLSFASESS